jgi:hypothetical protein
MKNFHPLSFVLGLASGFLILFLAISGLHALRPTQTGFSAAGGAFQQGSGAPNLARMAQRFGMTESELQKELASGKTIQQIAQERGVQFGGRKNGSGSLVGVTATGAISNPQSTTGATIAPILKTPSSRSAQ